VTKSLKGSYLAARVGLVLSLVFLSCVGRSHLGAFLALAVWGVCFGAANLCQINLVLAAAPDRFEAAMAINTLGYNLSIALGALVGGVFADATGVAGAVWSGAALAAVSVLVTVTTRRSEPGATSDAGKTLTAVG
jgi:predicted MFS family arabinose efflux permease